MPSSVTHTALKSKRRVSEQVSVLTLTPTLTIPSPLALALTHRQWMLVSLMLPVYRAGGAMVLMTSLLTP